MIKCKYFLIHSFLIIALVLPARSQESRSTGKNTIVYSVVVNKVPDGFNFPLIGFLNVAEGSHAGAQVGFINRNQKNFRGLQLSFINAVGGNVNGVQSGFVNASSENYDGLQLGFVNALAGTLKGSQIGFVNVAVPQVKGLQMAFVNASGGEVKGMQMGFVNVSGGEVKGMQTGFVNISKVVKGLQFGFVNLADSLVKGFPIGFLSFVRKGGYQALELSLTESFPFNLSFKTGIKALYTSLMFSWNPDYGEHYALGLGIGSIIPISRSVYFNPEVTAQGTYPDYHEIYGLTTQLGFALNRRLHLSLGPSLVWLNRESREYFYDPLFYFYEYRVDDKNKIVMGARISLKYNFSK
jgi:hypothetical protein